MNSDRRAHPPAPQPVHLPLAGRLGLAGWWRRWQRRRLTAQIVAVQRLLADEFASVETAALHDELDALCARRADIDAELAGLR